MLLIHFFVDVANEITEIRKQFNNVNRSIQLTTQVMFDLPVRNFKRPITDVHTETPRISTKPQRYKWDHSQIDKLAKSSEVYEKKFGQVLQSKLGPQYIVTAHEDKFNRYDFVISKIQTKSSEEMDVNKKSTNASTVFIEPMVSKEVILDPRLTILDILKEEKCTSSSSLPPQQSQSLPIRQPAPKTIRIELECGVMQGQWISKISDNRMKWVQGLNVVSRKISEGQHFSIFIKHNMECNSFFAATYNFIKTHAHMKVQKTNAVKFKTDNVVFSIPWSFITEKREDFCYDDFESLRILIENHFK